MYEKLIKRKLSVLLAVTVWKQAVHVEMIEACLAYEKARDDLLAIFDREFPLEELKKEGEGGGSDDKVL